MFLRLIVAILAVAAIPLASHAALFRTYLSVSGDDASDCTVRTPCRLLPAALAAVTDGGEVWILDSGNFNGGTVDVAKSVSILAVPGVVGSFVAVNGGAALTVTTPGLKIGLRNVVVSRNAVSPGFDGIVMSAASSLSVEDSLFINLTSNAISVTGAGAVVHVKNTTVRNSAKAVAVSDGAEANVSHCEFLSVTYGVHASANVAATSSRANVTDSTISGLRSSTGGSTWGVLASSIGTADARIFVTRSTIHGMTYGAEIAGSAGSVVTISNSSVTGNGTGVRNMSSGMLRTTGNNDIYDNDGDAAGTITTSPLR